VVRLTDSLFIAAGAVAFLLAGAAHWLLYARLLSPALTDDDLEARAHALKRWLAWAVGIQILVVVGAGLYVLMLVLRHQRGIAWVAPGLGAVIGTALPLQVVVSRLLRSATRG
jgi:hypothetical protein